MKVVAEIVAAIILLTLGGYLAPKELRALKRKLFDKGLPPLSALTII